MNAIAIRTCRGCGCDDLHACQPEGCYWAEADLCSHCVATSIASYHVRNVVDLRARRVPDGVVVHLAWLDGALTLDGDGTRALEYSDEVTAVEAFQQALAGMAATVLAAIR